MKVDQRTFKTVMMDPAAPVPDGLRNADNGPAGKRFNVYRNNVAVSLTEALETAFPVVRKLVGDEFFKAMAGVFLRLHPPKTPLMMFYGDAMPQFLRRFGTAQSLGYLPDVARLELTLRTSYHAADATPVKPDALGSIAPDALMGVRFTFAPAVQVITSAYPIYGIYRANTMNAGPPGKAAESVLITRPQFDTQLHVLTPAATAFITNLMDGGTLGAALAAADDTLDLGAVIGLLLGQGAITAIS